MKTRETLLIEFSLFQAACHSHPHLEFVILPDSPFKWVPPQGKPSAAGGVGKQKALYPAGSAELFPLK